MNLASILTFLLLGLLAAGQLALYLQARQRAAAPGTEELAALARALERIERVQREEMARSRAEAAEAARLGRLEAGEAARAAREEVAVALRRYGELQAEHLQGVAQLLRGQLQTLGEQQARDLGALAAGNEHKLEALRSTLHERLQAMQADNGRKLDEMRQTVDEKLHKTLEQRLGDSFRLVSERLELVHRGLGEMQTLAAGVGDLKKVLTNVKTRGTWGEVQLGALLEQVLTADQFARNVATRPGAAERVEFAIRLPGAGREGEGAPVWLPVDAKFPLEDYQRLQDAQERGDLPALEAAGGALEARVRQEAKRIRDKYVAPPHTTDFAILYLPSEGLYAEVLRRPGLAEGLQRDCRVSVAGPTTLAAMLNSLQMGFRTLAIEKRSSEVWMVLGAVKGEFAKFGEALAHTRKKLEEASNSIARAETRNRVLTRKLQDVEALPPAEAEGVLGLTLSGQDDGPGD